jgi:hypothetical protein
MSLYLVWLSCLLRARDGHSQTDSAFTEVLENMARVVAARQQGGGTTILINEPYEDLIASRI